MADSKKRARLSHVRQDGSAVMVDVSAKDVTQRVAVADGAVVMAPATLRVLTEGQAAKGDVLAVARLAGIQGAKRTADLVPLCHPLPLTHVAVDLTPDPALPGVRICATVKTVGRTGVEMEALTAVACAALAIYDMLKAVDRAMVIREISVGLKDGGKTGRYQRRGRQTGTAGKGMA